MVRIFIILFLTTQKCFAYIVKYDKGVYYIPKQTRFTLLAEPDPETVARYRYKTHG